MIVSSGLEIDLTEIIDILVSVIRKGEYDNLGSREKQLPSRIGIQFGD
jgi:hypothetical protein